MRLLAIFSALLLTSAQPALAHVGAGATHAFAAGLAHPFGGIDHLAAMLAIGVWAALAGGRKIWLWPAAFVAAMVAGGGLGASGVAMPFVEPMIAASLVVLGLAIALAVHAPAWTGAALVALFALAHGHAHGTEAAGAAVLAYGSGFVVATAALHAAGIALAIYGQRLTGLVPVRLAGAATAVLGLALLARIGGGA